MNWKEYEQEIHNLLKEQYPESEIRHDVYIPGRYSNIDRQIDILIEDYVVGNRIKIIVDGKYFSKNIDVKEVEKFIGLLNDCNAQKGLLITKEGYSDAAVNRAHYDPRNIELDILNFKELKHFQAFEAIPYAGSHGALVPSPFGWVIDGQQYGFALATIYQRGLGLHEAQQNNEWMYINFWNRGDKEASSLEELLQLQEENIEEAYDNYEIDYLPTVKRINYETKVRRSVIDTYSVPEYTGFIEFDEFIFFCILFSPKELKAKNLKKLEYMLLKTLPLSVVQE